MTAARIHHAINSGSESDLQEALLALLAVTETLATAVLEPAGERRLASGSDPLSLRSRTLLTEFIELLDEMTANPATKGD